MHSTRIKNIGLIILLVMGFVTADNNNMEINGCPCLNRELCPRILGSHHEVRVYCELNFIEL